MCWASIRHSLSSPVQSAIAKAVSWGLGSCLGQLATVFPTKSKFFYAESDSVKTLIRVEESR